MSCASTSSTDPVISAPRRRPTLRIPIPEPQFNRTLSSSLGSPFLTASVDDLDDVSDFDLIDGTLSTVPHDHTIDRPASADFSVINAPGAGEQPDSYGTFSIFGTPILFRRSLPGATYSPLSSSPDRSIRSLFPRLWEVFYSSSRGAPPTRLRKRSGASAHQLAEKADGLDLDFEDDIERCSIDTGPLDDEEGELVEDEACFIQVTAITGIDIISLLPTEVSLNILSSYLDLPAILACLGVCKTWRRLANDNSVWMSLFSQNANISWAVDLDRWNTLRRLSGRKLADRNATASFGFVLEEWSRRRLGQGLPTHATESHIQTHHSTSPQMIMPRSHSLSAIDGLRSPVLGSPLSLEWRSLYEIRLELDKRWGIPCRSNKGEPSWQPELLRLSGHADSVYCLEFDSTRIVTGSRDRTIKVWSLGTGELLGTVRGHTGSVLCLKFDKDWDRNVTISNIARPCQLVSGSSDCTIRVWDMHSDSGSHEVSAELCSVLKGHTGGVLDLRMDSKRIVSCSKDTTICIWDRHTLSLLRVLKGHEGPVNAVGLQGQRVVSASGDGRMILWDTESGERIRTFEGHDRGLACIDFKDDYIVSGSNDCKIKVWSVSTGQCIRTLPGHTSLVRALAFDPKSGKLVSASYDKTVKVWDMHSGKLVREFKNIHTSHIFDVQFDVTKVVSASHDQQIVVLDFSFGLDTSLFI